MASDEVLNAVTGSIRLAGIQFFLSGLLPDVDVCVFPQHL
jgi:hypothetical protein